ncbi:MAG TPA: peptidase S8 [Candidatus Nitrosotalea sp.]|nr:peptidase S8 [Candidatus Nitrosotalea sp.]
MNGSLRLSGSLVLALAIAACSAGGTSNVPAIGGATSQSARSIPEWQANHLAVPACAGSRVNQMQCDALIVRTGIGPDVAGWTPSALQTRYNLPSSSKGKGTIVAIVDAFDNPNVASDLAAYRSEFGLPAAKFYKYNQKGQQKNYPTGNKGWGVEIDLDVEMASAACPNCTIYLIESKNNSGNSLYAAEKTAVRLGAHIVSNSWGGGAGSASGGAFAMKGVTYLASAGDSGYGMQDPADYPTVISVGGTLLHYASSKYTESVWSDSGGGCSVVAKPSWQSDPGCSERTGNDVAAVAWGVAEYDTYGYNGWFTIGGTSVSSPLLAGVFGLTSNATKQEGGKNFWSAPDKKRAKYLHEITSGSLAHCPSQYASTYICSAGTNQFGTYSGPSGWGTPNGIGAF